ncbi:predicted protein [Botrytis cinerea T4]|uniref:Uncharacterized protein n=1 Tax=Botryotinia fuckeliana (strain T4) TaxID=999810 RepID=G2XPU5_BOTF4|nr:predicted protein [Botrytis cinerea T4]
MEFYTNDMTNMTIHNAKSSTARPITENFPAIPDLSCSRFFATIRYNIPKKRSYAHYQPSESIKGFYEYIVV